MKSIYLLCCAMITLVVSCHQESNHPQQTITQSEIKPVASISRIVSLAPSFTQIIYDLELQDNLVAISSLCPSLPGQKNITRLGTFSPVMSQEESEKRKHQCLRLNPTLILSHSHMFKKETAQSLPNILREVDQKIDNLDDLLEYILLVSKITQSLAQGQVIVKHIKSSLIHIRIGLQEKERKRALLIINQNPLEVLSHRSFFSSVLERYANIQNISPHNTLVSHLDHQDIETLDPDIILDFSGNNKNPRDRVARLNNDRKTIQGSPSWLIPSSNVIYCTQEITQIVYP